MNKRISFLSLISILLAAVMLFGACGENPSVGSSGAVSSSDAASSGEKTSDGGSSEPASSEPSELPYDPAQYPVEDLTNAEDTMPVLNVSGGYDGTLRVKSSGELLLSPFLPDLYDDMKARGWDVTTSLYAMLTFTLLDENLHSYSSYAPVKASFGPSKGQFFDIWLQGEELDCGFCPTSGRIYNILMDVYAAEDGIFDGKKKDECIGRAEMRYIGVSEAYAASPYYRPTEIPTERTAVEQLVLSYRAAEGGKIEGILRQGVAYDGNGSAKVTAIADEGYIFVGWSDGVATASRFGDKPETDTEYVANFMESQITPGVATMIINTEYGMPIWDTSNYQPATMTVVGANKEKFNISTTLQIRGRGNSSFDGGADRTYDYNSKNSYRLKLDEKQQLLGVGSSKNRDWVLNANKFDASNLRNYAVWLLADRMGSINYVPSCTWVQLYLNGDYRGVYMLTEFVETGADRVPVEGLDNEKDPGFLLELDFRGKSGKKDVDYFMLSNFDSKRENSSTPFVVKSDNASAAVTKKIKAFMQQCNDAITGGKKEEIEKLIDLPSFVDMFIIEELGKDCDMGGASMYFCRDSGGKLRFTAPWDFDFCFGTYGPACSYYDLCIDSEHENIWMRRLLENGWFREMLLARMQELKDIGALESVYAGIKVQGVTLKAAADKNDERWGIYGNDYHDYVSHEVSGLMYSYEDHIRYLVDWIGVRYDILMDCIKGYPKNGGRTPYESRGSFGEEEAFAWLDENRERYNEEREKRRGDHGFDWENIDWDSFDWENIDRFFDTEKTIDPPTTEPDEG